MARDRVLPTSLITLHILAVTVVLCSTFIAVFAEVGAPCSQDSGCTTPNETCAGTECACAANYYNASNSCVQTTDQTVTSSPDIVSSSSAASSSNTAITSVTTVPETSTTSTDNTTSCTSTTSATATTSPTTATNISSTTVNPSTTADQDNSTITPADQNDTSTTTDWSSTSTAGQTTGFSDTTVAESTIASCDCNETTYYDGERCQPKIGYSEVCHETTQCLNNLTCSEAGICDCNSTEFYNYTTESCEMKKGYDKACNESRECLNNLACSEAGKCNCNSTEFYNDTAESCDMRLFIGESCTNSSQCVNTSHCMDDTKTCQCTDDNYSKDDTTCVPKTAHGQPCNSDDQCLVGSCSDTDKCLCGPNQYYHSTSISCNSTDDLKVTAVTASNRGTNSVELTLTADAHGTNVKYMVKPNDDASLTKNFTGTEFTVSDLTSGTEYTFTVTPVLPADTNYPEKTAGFEMSSPVWTIPAAPGRESGTQLTSNVTQPVQYDITFVASQGQVSHYTMKINSETVQTTGSATTVRFTRLQPGQSYSYTITAYNGNDPQDSSAPTTGMLTTSTNTVTHGQQCDDVGYLCQASSSLTCTNYTSNVKRCLCQGGTFYNPSARTCADLTILQVSVTENATVTTTTNVTLTWTANKYTANVSYEITANTGGTPVTATQTGGLVSGLDSGKQYTFTITSVLQADTYYNEKRTSVSSQPVWTKIAHAEKCDLNNQPDTICEDQNAACILSSAGDNRCLCAAGYYRSADNKTCNSLDGLKVTNIQASQRLTNSMTLTWDADKHGTNVTYTIKPSGGTGISGTSSPVTGLTPGTPYNFTITSVLPAAGYYPEKNVSSTSSEFWTKPDKPGVVENILLVRNQSGQYDYDISFVASQGNVSHYTMTVNSETGQTTASATTFRFTRLQPGQSYSYSITAYNGNNDSSEPSTGNLTTPVIASGPVTNLSATEITSNQAKATWKKPDEPNGEITSYTLTVEEKSACVYRHIIRCSDCSTPAPPGNIASCQDSGSENKTSADLNNNSTTFTVSISNLRPYHNYTLKVTADNNEGVGAIENYPFRTLSAAAKNVTDVTAASTRNSISGKVDLKVTWTPGDFTGPTNYLVTLEEEISLGLNRFKQSVAETVTGYNTNEWTKTNVLAYWNYRVSVLAMTDVGNSGNVGNKTVQTEINTPGRPQSVTVNQNGTVAQELALTVTCPEEKERNGIITGYIICKKLLNATGGVENEKEYTVEADSSLTCNNTYTAERVDGIIVEKNYTFEVKVRNTKYNSTDFYPDPAVHLYVEPRAPRFEEIKQSYGVSSLVRQQEDSKTLNTAIDVSVCASCLQDSRQGTVKNVGLVVCKVDTNGKCVGGARKRRSPVNFMDYTTWSVAHDQNFKVPYRATPDDWMSLLTSPNTSYPYRIGTNANCRTDATTVHCNGPLPEDTIFRVAVIQCNSVGCVIGTFEGPFRTGAEEEPTPVGAIVGGVVAVLVVAAIVAGVAFFLWRRRKGKPTRTSNPIWDIDNQSKQNVPPPVSRPIRIRDFKDEVTKMHKDCNLMFQDQFEDIKKLSAELNATTNEAQREGNRVKNRYVDILPLNERFQATTNEAQREANRVKNRYVDILPYDHSRVKLSTTPDDDETMDFINANYIAGYSSVREYIATQGPMHCTIPDFWRMAWEQNCRVIVMLSDLQENGKRKVGLYWPENLNDPINYGTVVVEMTNFSQLNKYIIRNFVVKKGNETRKMTHFFLPGWWDFSANLTFDDVLEFAKLVRQEATPHTDGPIIVHCSAGVGRTGTLIALDYFMQFIDKHSLDDTIDVYKFVLEMRKNRPRMVQAETQYIFIFDALVEVIQNKIKAEEERLYDNCGQGNNIYANVGNKQEENIYANTEKNAYVYNNEAFEPEYQNMEMKSQDKTEKPTTEL